MQVIQRRIGFLFAIFLVLLSGAGARASWLSMVEGHKLKRAAVSQQRVRLALPAPRGSIEDRNGNELATSEPAVTITATPYLIRNPQRVATQLAEILGLESQKVFAALTRRSGFSYIARHVAAAQAESVKQLKITGLDFVDEYRRAYPNEWMATQVLGSVGIDGDGLSGLEYSLDRYLRGSPGERNLVKDARGRPIETRDAKQPHPGARVRLTIDSVIQAHVESVLKAIGEESQPKGATAIVMRPRTGEILALGNWPSVDASDPSGAPVTALQDRAVGTLYEPGSTFKAITVAGALEEHKVTPTTSFNLAPSLRMGERNIGAGHDRGWTTLTTADILKQSDNVGAITIALSEGADRFDYWVRRFGFGRTTGVDLPGDQSGIVLKRQDYSPSSMGNLPIGQGIAVTPMQMAVAYAAIANGGLLRPPHIVASIGGKKTQPKPAQRVISPQTAMALREMLEGVLGPGGTASGAAIHNYVLAGKTGTAQKFDSETGKYSESKYVASFVGFAPAQRPELLAIVTVDEPSKGIHAGGLVAAPPWRDIMSFALTYLKVPPRSDHG